MEKSSVTPEPPGSEKRQVNPSSAETRSCLDNKVSTTATDTLAPFITRTSAAIILTPQHKEILIFQEEIFQLATSPKGWEIVEMQI